MMYEKVMTAVGSCVVDWHECGENPAIFCYRMGAGAFAGLRTWASVATPAWESSARETLRCWNPSGNFSIRFTTLKD
jgi:hypothetical protein